MRTSVFRQPSGSSEEAGSIRLGGGPQRPRADRSDASRPALGGNPGQDTPLRAAKKISVLANTRAEKRSAFRHLHRRSPMSDVTLAISGEVKVFRDAIAAIVDQSPNVSRSWR